MGDYNPMIELGPRGTGKSHLFQQVSSYAHLISGGRATVARMFVHMGTGQRVLVCQYDVVCFEEIFASVRKSQSFSFETTLSGRSYSRHIPEWRSSGYKVKLFYLRLATPELAIVRVRKLKKHKLY
ncbi:MAG: BREX system Lon protease-like protein BrxL [Desulfonatronovibrio sp.]|nr:hypothetical protein [Desulfovibrionales bacterium]